MDTAKESGRNTVRKERCGGETGNGKAEKSDNTSSLLSSLQFNLSSINTDATN